MSIPSSFDVSGSSGALGAFLATNYSGGGLYAALGTADSSGAAATATALGAGGLTTDEHNVIAAVGANGTTPTSIPWNTNGTEPTLLTQIRDYGWIRLVGRSGDTSGNAAGTYTLAPVGEAIYKRTGGGVDGASAALTNSSLNSGSASGTNVGLSSSQLSTLNTLLSGLGGSTGLGNLATSGSTTSSGVISTGSTGSLLNVIA